MSNNTWLDIKVEREERARAEREPEPVPIEDRHMDKATEQAERDITRGLIQHLRDGDDLSISNMAAVCDEIRDMFDRVAEIWSKKYFAPASIELDGLTYLCFLKLGTGWHFATGNDDSKIQVPVLNDSLQVRLQVAHGLPRLEAELKKVGAAQKRGLLEALDELQDIVDECERENVKS